MALLNVKSILLFQKGTLGLQYHKIHPWVLQKTRCHYLLMGRKYYICLCQCCNYLMKKHILLFVLLNTCFLLQAKYYDLINLTNNDGLSNSSITTISQHSSGLMWFGTWDGLNAYNGREFKVYKPEPGNPLSICNNIIRDIIEENNETLWIATDLGISRMNLQRETFDCFFSDGKDHVVYNEHAYLIAKNSMNQIFTAIYGQGIFLFSREEGVFEKLQSAEGFLFKKIFFDLDDNLWIFTEDKMLFKIVFKKGEKDQAIVHNIVEFQHVKNIAAVFYDGNNEVWIQTADNQLFSYSISEGLATQHVFESSLVGSIRSMLFMETYQLWGTERGLYRLNLETKSLEPILPNLSVLYMYAGSQQIIWVGTDMQGVWMLTPPMEKFRTYSAENIEHFGESAVRTFFEDAQNRLWVGTKGSGIFVLDKTIDNQQLQTSIRFTKEDGLLSNSVFTIVPGGEKEYWIGTDGSGINYYDLSAQKIQSLVIPDDLKNQVHLSAVYSIYVQNQHTIWVGTSGFGMYKLQIDRSTYPYSISAFKQFVYHNDTDNSLSNNIVYSIIQDDDTHLWIATRGGGINRFHIEDEIFQTYRFSLDNKGFISSDDVLCLYKDTQGILWAGTSMGLHKLICFDENRPVFKRFTEQEGMPNNTIHGILEDQDNHLWLSTNQGVAKLIQQGEDYRIVTYYKKDGLQNNEFSDGAFYKNFKTQELYFGGISGFNIFNPAEIRYGSYMPSLYLDAFFIDNTEFVLEDYMKVAKGKSSLVLSYKNKSFSFRFTPMDYLAGSKCELAYILEGFQKDWVQLGTSNAIVFSNLPTGHYSLKVKCSNAEKIWSEEFLTIPISMNPPWWKSFYAYIAYFITLVLLFFAVLRMIRYQMKVKQDIRLQALEKQKSEEIHQAKLQFFTNIAHEFSNLLTLIYGPCEQLLRTHAVDKFSQKYIHIIQSNSERMQRLIKQLIEFRRAETGYLHMVIEQIDIEELIRFVLDNFLEVFEQKKIHLVQNFSSPNIRWNTDRDGLEKIIFNLISNAAKYTPENETIDISVEIDDANRCLQLRITNTGVGIKETDHYRIFDRFEVLERLEKQVMRKTQMSTGIGLALCKSLTEVLQGSIHLESDGATYTSFFVSLPEQEVPATEFSERSELSKEKMQISPIGAKPLDVAGEIASIPDTQRNGLLLIVDDDPDICELLKDFLIDKYEVATAGNGQEAIDLMRLRLPVLIISDIKMPVMDGIEFLHLIKSQELTRHIPMILLSTKSSIENQIEGIETGADAYLGKPFHPRHLEAIIERLLDRNKTILDFSKSPYAALAQFEGKLIHKEDKNFMYRVTSIIYDQIDKDALSIDSLADELAISKMQLYRKMKEITDQTPTEYIRSLRLKHAEKLLKTTNQTVLEIMYACGFNNKGYFYREFAKRYHNTPSEYRKKFE